MADFVSSLALITECSFSEMSRVSTGPSHLEGHLIFQGIMSCLTSYLLLMRQYLNSVKVEISLNQKSDSNANYAGGQSKQFFFFFF